MSCLTTQLIRTLLIFALFVVSPLHAATVLKVATLAPPGSSWDKIIVEMNEELKQKTGGALELKVYSGGVQGDEKAVVQKLRIGQLHGAGFTGVGMGLVSSQLRILELPFLLRTNEQVDAVIEKMTPSLKQALAAGNPPLEFLGWAHPGFVKILSNKPIANLNDLKGVKMWMWEGDPVAESLYKEIGMAPIQLSITDVLTALQTNMVEGVYAPPLAAIALQWASKVKYVTDLPIVHSVGAMVVAKKSYDALPQAQQQALRTVTEKHCKQITASTRLDNERAMEALKKLGVKTVSVKPEDAQALVEVSKRVWQNLAGKLYTQAQLTQLQSYLP